MAEKDIEDHNTNPEEEILKEIKETDWSEDTVEQEDFDIADLECVDEESEDRRSDDRRSARKNNLNKRSENRCGPYKMPPNRHNKAAPSPQKISPRKDAKPSPSRLARDKKRRKEYHEKKRAERSARHEGGINLDELEEIDSFEFNDNDEEDATVSESLSSSCHTDSPASTPVLHDDPWTAAISEDRDFPTMDDEDFPALCEEIDPDILRRAVAESILKKATESPATDNSQGTSPETSTRGNGACSIKEPTSNGNSLKEQSLSPWRMWDERRTGKRPRSTSRDGSNKKKERSSTRRTSPPSKSRTTGLRHEKHGENKRRGEEKGSCVPPGWTGYWFGVILCVKALPRFPYFFVPRTGMLQRCHPRNQPGRLKAPEIPRRRHRHDGMSRRNEEDKMVSSLLRLAGK